MEAWRQVFREGIAPQFSGKALRSLLEAVRRDDPRLTQSVLAAGCGAGIKRCGIAWLVEAEQGSSTVYRIEQGFTEAAATCAQLTGRCIAAFLNWFDDAPRLEMRRELAWEIDLELMVRLARAEDRGPMVGDGLVAEEVAAGV